MKKDLIVVGGGFAGCAAALAAARQGISVLLVEQGGSLGGAAVNSLVNPFMPYTTVVEEDGKRKKINLSAGIFMEILDRLQEIGGLDSNRATFHEEYLKLLLDRMMKEAGVTVAYHCTLSGVEKENDMLKSITVTSKAGLIRLEANYFIDSTGDADLAVMSGCPTHLGRPQDNLCQPMTLCFRVGNIDKEKFFDARPEMQKKYKQFQAEGKIKNPRENILVFDTMVDGMLHFNTTRIIKLNPVDPFDVSRAEMEAREQMFEVFYFMKEHAGGFENAQLLFSAAQIGTRESRMIDGKYLLTQEDLKNCTRFDDAIAAGNYDIDIHNPEGTGTSHYYFPEGEYYTLPYRSLLPNGADNLLVAGRCISSTHEAQASYRVMPIVCCLGEAAGVGAAVACKASCKPEEADIKEIQKILVENNAFIGL